MKTVILLHGHSSWDTGATKIVDGKSVTESELVRDICTRVYNNTCELRDTRVILVPRKKSLTELTKFINKLTRNELRDAVIIEVHLNACGDSNVDRIETICYKGSKNGQILAQTALEIMQSVKGKSSGDRVLLRDKNEDGGYLCYNVIPVAILTEYAFLSSNKFDTLDKIKLMCDDYVTALTKIITKIR